MNHDEEHARPLSDLVEVLQSPIHLEFEVARMEPLFSDKEESRYYVTGVMDDPGLTERLYNAGAEVTLASGTDLAGNPRVKGRCIDIGAYESQYQAFSVKVR